MPHKHSNLRSLNRPLDAIATDQMDLDTGAMADDSGLNQDGLRTEPDGSVSTLGDEAEVIDLLDVDEDDLEESTHSDQQNHLPEQPPAKKQKVSFFPPFLGLSPSPRNSHQEPTQGDVKSLRARLQVPYGRSIELQKTIEKLEKEKAEAGREIERLKHEIDPVRQKNEHLQRWIKFGEQQYGNLLNSYRDLVQKHNTLAQDLEMEKQDHLQHNAELEARVNDLARTNDQFRQMIVPVSEKQVPDCDLVSKFTGLRASIIGLVRQTWKPVLKADVDLEQLSGRQRHFFGSRLPLSYNRLRSAVFEIMTSFILGAPNYFLGEAFDPLESYLQATEEKLYKDLSKEDRPLITEWRNATFNATKAFRDNGDGLSSATQNEIWLYLSPLQAKNAAAEENGRKKLKSICDNAIELSLMMRQSKDCFWVYNLENNVSRQASRCQRLAEEVESVAAVDDHAVGTVAYVITGALMKFPKEDPKKRLVLEKGEVAVFE